MGVYQHFLKNTITPIVTRWKRLKNFKQFSFATLRRTHHLFSIAMQQPQLSRSIRYWLLTGVILVLFQVVIGGVTRLTDSGLSITEWAVIQGTVPPMNEAQWLEAFDKYRTAAKKQYENLHADMTISEFKVIFFWEYLHRLWARLMGLVFLLPFLYFFFKKMFPRWLIKRLCVVLGLAIVAAVFGWIMVKSGLHNDKRTWVSAYKLVLHLGIATALFGYLFWTWLKAEFPKVSSSNLPALRRLSLAIATVVLIQIAVGGLMAGMRAALIHPHFPVFIEGQRIWQALVTTPNISIEHFVDYEPHLFAKAVVQIAHRTLAWILVVLVLVLAIPLLKSSLPYPLRNGARVLIVLLITQFLFGILTVIHSVGKVPLVYGTLHQAVALLLFSCCLFLTYHLKTDLSQSRSQMGDE